MWLRVFLSFFLYISCIATTFAATLTHEYQLRNGLKVIVREDHRAPIVFSSIWYKVGGSYEQNGITGISHMLEHMMFQGTKKYPPGYIFKTISQHGGQQNAITSDDFTTYYQVLPAKYLPLSFQIEADRMVNLSLQAKRFASEHQVVLEERRMRVDDQPMGLTWLRFRAAAHVNNPYHHSTIGWLPDIQGLTLKDLTHWYQTWYQPNNATLIVVGDVKPEDVLSLAKQYFGNIPQGVIPQLKPRTEIPSLGKRHIVVNVPAKLPYLLLGYNVPSLATAKSSWQAYALLVLAGVLDAGDSSRLPKELIRGQQIAASVGASYSLYRLHDDLFVLSAIPVPGHSLIQLQHALLQQIKKLRTEPITTAELERIKAQVIASNIFKKDSLTEQAMDIGTPEMVGLSWRDEEDFVKRVSAITPAQLQKVAKEFLISRNLTIAELKPLPQSQPANQKQD